MTPAVANLSLARDTDYEVSLVIQDAAAQPIDLTGCALAASIKAASGAAAVDLAIAVTDAAAGLATVYVPAQPLGMAGWELWMQAAPETPRERVLRGLVTVSDRVDPRDEGNPSSHRLIVRISDAVKVSLDSVDLAWWAYEQTSKLLGVDYAATAQAAAGEAKKIQDDMTQIQASINTQVAGFDGHVKTSVDAVNAAKNEIVDAVSQAVNNMLGFYISVDEEGTWRTHNNGKLIIGDRLFYGTNPSPDPITLLIEDAPFLCLVRGRYMFSSSAMINFTWSLPSLTDGTCMFQDCRALVSFNADMPSLTDSTSMFSNCQFLANFQSDCSRLVDSTSMFESCIRLEAFDIDLPVLQVGKKMFFRCRALTTFVSSLPLLVDGTSMFGQSGLTNFNVDLSSLKTGTNMFYNSSLTHFDGNLPVLVDGVGMFAYCPLTRFDAALPALENGTIMFNKSGLTNFNVDLPSLKNGYQMFEQCTALTSFESDVPALTSASRMFYGCALDAAAINAILMRLPIMVDGYSHVIGFQGCPGAAAADKSVATFKGWTVEI